MEEDRNAPPRANNLQELREVAQRLPPADDMAADNPLPAQAAPTVSPTLQKLKTTLIRVRWSLLAVMATALLSLIGALITKTLAHSRAENWALAMIVMGLVLAVTMALDTLLQWSERVRFDQVEEREAAFLSQAARKAAQIFNER